MTHVKRTVRFTCVETAGFRQDADQPRPANGRAKVAGGRRLEAHSNITYPCLGWSVVSLFFLI
jgi:hypothetical protein